MYLECSLDWDLDGQNVLESFLCPIPMARLAFFLPSAVVLLWEAAGLIVPIALFLAVCHLAVPSSLATVLYWLLFLPCGFA